MAHTIVSKAYGMVYNEYDAQVAGIYPGMNLELITETEVRHHATAGGAGLLVAVEDALQGHDQDEVYVIDNPVRCWSPRPGDEFYGLIAPDEVISAGEGVISNGVGTFKSATDSGLSAPVILATSVTDVNTNGETGNTLALLRAL